MYTTDRNPTINKVEIIKVLIIGNSGRGFRDTNGYRFQGLISAHLSFLFSLEGL